MRYIPHPNGRKYLSLDEVANTYTMEIRRLMASASIKKNTTKKK